MNKWLFISILSIFAAFAGFVFFQKSVSLPAIIYFPIDQETTFVTTHTGVELYAEQNNNKHEITWTSSSKSDKKVYLRQDASLLFENGRLRGVLSKWKENEDTIELGQKLFGEDSSYYQAISFHHGEVHYPDDQIKSIQQMSYDELFVIDSPTTPLDSFHIAQGDVEEEWKEILEGTTKQQLLYQWNHLIHHFNIKKEDYLIVPLTSLYRYNQESLPGRSQKETNQIIGQLWEGLYKNYIMQTTAEANGTISSYIPIILFAKDQSHLLVLYEINGEKERLIQQIQ